ncbi:DNA polymerase III subunit gamma/tau [Vagococcus xieshaowenii]|uniref:DNA-directed DNA polymerase n=1 Tax=Vagococcus xieshaowenii TaxID=2562451 RepID=A0AAJ5EFR2_9ENTE|nr:DNA polymerase III subunit gamma/tau [Vagococcus xieshaowenii]QCA29096.1 DNA polymerase III subunit gamma/tau [Vagococcus xieshaowenii]TFZ40928.1 DNA polymerase III subunit gamma/tau [Vagococcus xieshaowenii]
MAYQALYRVWRSQRFDDIVGQKAVTQTLKNALSQHKTSHAYLFTGPRGTGKTSAAKIFAKAINCPNQVDGEPCNECHICKEITEGRLNDVIEIDAASNNGVDEIREIREKVKYAPTQVSYKVYIIDEVHMLSTGAFNALLKTLEEPPQNVLFILATTEPHKIPATIISRTQRFDFKRIQTEDIVEHLGYILNDMAISYDDQSLYIIARAAEGGMRDALSLLDQALSFSDERLTEQDALQVTGSLTHEMMDQYLMDCSNGEVEAALSGVQKILSEGKEANRFIEDVLLYSRDLLVYKQAPEFLRLQRGYVSDPFKELANTLSNEKIYRYIDLLSEAQQQLKISTHSTVYLEVVTVKLAKLRLTQAPKEGEIPQNQAGVSSDEWQQLQQQITELRQQLEQVKQTGVTVSNVSAPQTPAKAKPSQYKLPKGLVYNVLREATRESLRETQDVWSDLLQMLSTRERGMIRNSHPVAASSTEVVVTFDSDFVCHMLNNDDSLQQAIQTNLQRLIQKPLKAVFIPEVSWAMLRNDYLKEHPFDKKQEATISSEVNVPELNDQQASEQVVEKAIEFFGEDLVEISEE